MPNGIRPKLRQGIWYAVGTFDGQRIRKSLGARDEATAREQCAIFEARLWKRHSYGEEAVRTFEEAALSYLEQGGEGRFLPPVMKHFRGVALAKIKPGDVREMAIAPVFKAFFAAWQGGSRTGVHGCALWCGTEPAQSVPLAFRTPRT